MGVIELLKDYVGKTIVLSSESCPDCERIGDELNDAVYVYIGKDDLADMLADAFGASPPSLFRVDIDGNKAYVCKLKDDAEVESCVEVEQEEE